MAPEKLFSLLLITLLLCVPGRVNAQPDLRVKGYLEHQYSVSYNDGRWSHLDYDRARVDVSARAGRGTRLSIAPVWQLFRGDTEVALADFLPEALQPFVDEITIPTEDRLFLNHAYLTLRPGPLELTVGKQYLAWGAALAFNPTELFRPKNLLEPTYEREGIGAITARLPLGVLSDVMIGLVPDGSLAESGKLFRLRHHIAGYDVSLLAAVLSESPLPAGITFQDLAEERRFTLGGDVTGELFGIGAWAEAAWSDLGDQQWLEITIGSNYTLAAGTRMMVEYYYNGRGESGRPYSLSQWAGRLIGVLRSMSKSIVYGTVVHPVDEFQLWNVGMSSLVSASDGSLVLIPSVAYAFAENVDLLFNALIYAGNDGTEYAGRRFGAFIRARVYF